MGIKQSNTQVLGEKVITIVILMQRASPVDLQTRSMRRENPDNMAHPRLVPAFALPFFYYL